VILTIINSGSKVTVAAGAYYLPSMLSLSVCPELLLRLLLAFPLSSLPLLRFLLRDLLRDMLPALLSFERDVIVLEGLAVGAWEELVVGVWEGLVVGVWEGVLEGAWDGLLVGASVIQKAA
jgi:hypothetical protein